VPFGPLLFFAKTVARNIGQFLPAERLALLPWRGELLGPAICYEVVFPEETAALTQAGATILVTITNDGWYGDTAAPWQHLRAARFRAAENRRPMLRAAITGVSAVIAPDGSVRGELDVGDEGVIRAAVAGERVMTPYARWPWLPPFAATVAALAAILATRRARRRILPRVEIAAAGETIAADEAIAAGETAATLETAAAGETAAAAATTAAAGEAAEAAAQNPALARGVDS